MQSKHILQSLDTLLLQMVVLVDSLETFCEKELLISQQC